MPEGPEMTRVKQNDIDWYSNSSTRIAKRRQLERHGKTDRRFVNVPTNRQALPAHLSSNLGICCNVRQNAMGLETPELVTAAVYRKRQENMVQINSNNKFHCPSCPSCPCLSMDFNIFQPFLCYQNGHPEAIGFLIGLQQHDLFAATAQFLRNFTTFFPPVPSTAVK